MTKMELLKELDAMSEKEHKRRKIINTAISLALLPCIVYMVIICATMFIILGEVIIYGIDNRIETTNKSNEPIEKIVYEDTYSVEVGVSDDDSTYKYSLTGQITSNPILYLYDYSNSGLDIKVKVQSDSSIDYSYPEFNDENTWVVKTDSDGKITYNNEQYQELTWKDTVNTTLILNSGVCVTGEQTRYFLAATLSSMGITDKEANEFITLWLPKMENNKYNIISFQNSDDNLDVCPIPDNKIQVCMVWRASDSFVEIEKQKFEKLNREGLTLVEMTGYELSPFITSNET